MRSLRDEAPPARHAMVCALRITEREVNEAISLSVALKRPDRNVGAIIASSASSFTDGSARVYISVVCMWACPSQSETLRRSLVACRTVSAQVCRSTWGETRFADSDGQVVVAVCDVFGEDVLETRARQRLAACADEDLGRGHGAPHAQPRAQRGGRDFPQRQAALASTLAVDEDRRLRLKRDVARAASRRARRRAARRRSRGGASRDRERRPSRTARARSRSPASPRPSGAGPAACRPSSVGSPGCAESDRSRRAHETPGSA